MSVTCSSIASGSRREKGPFIQAPCEALNVLQMVQSVRYGSSLLTICWICENLVVAQPKSFSCALISSLSVWASFSFSERELVCSACLSRFSMSPIDSNLAMSASYCISVSVKVPRRALSLSSNARCSAFALFVASFMMSTIFLGHSYAWMASVKSSCGNSNM